MKPATPAASRLLPVAALLFGNVALALGPWFVRLTDTGPVSAGFWRLGLALPVLALLARGSGQPMMSIPRGVLAAVALGGALFALDLASWHIGIGMTRLANATLFGNSGSLVLMVWGFIAWRRMPKGRERIAIVAALLGAALLLGRSLDISPRSFAGDLYCLTAGLFYAGYLVILKDARAKLGSWALLAWSCAAGAPILLVFALLLGEPVWPTDWGPVIGLAISSQLIGQGLLVYALRHFSALTIGVALLTQPGVAALAGWLAFAEALTPIDFAGIAMLGTALVLARSESPGARGDRARPQTP